MGWLSNKILRLSVNSQRKEMTIFVDTLRGMDPDEIAIGLAFATNFRNTIDLTLPSNLSLLDPFALVEAYPTITYENANGIKKLQKNGLYHQAAGVMVWQHTLRAALTPELRHLARTMWQELSRAMTSPTMLRAAMTIKLMGIPLTLDVNDYDVFPKGFEPQQTPDTIRF